MRIAISVGPDASRLRAVAREAEAIGVDLLQLADHLVDGLLSPFAALAVAAEATERLHVGTLVLANDFRHPALVAREAATLHELSGGRFELGLGAGHAKDEYDAAGIPFEEPRTRVARLGEAVTITRRLLDGEAVTFAGEHYTLDEHRLWPLPSTPMPLLVGGNGDRVLRIAARHADAVGFTGFGPRADASGPNMSHFTAAGLADRIDLVRRVAGPRFDRLDLQVLVQSVVVTDDRRAAAATIVERLPALGEDDVLESPFVLVGTVDEIADQLVERADRYGIGTWTMFADSGWSGQRLTDLAPIVAKTRERRPLGGRLSGENVTAD